MTDYQPSIPGAEVQTASPILSSRGQAQYEAGGMFRYFQKIMKDIYHPENNPDVCMSPAFTVINLNIILTF